MLEGGNDVRRHQRPLIEGDIVQRIEADRMREVGRIEIDHAVLDAPGRRGIGDRRRQVAVRVQEREAMTAHEIGEHQVVEQGGLAGAGLADDVEVPAQVAAREHDRRIQFEPDRGRSQLQAFFILGHGSPSEPVRSLAGERLCRGTACVWSGQAGGGRRPLNAAG